MIKNRKGGKLVTTGLFVLAYGPELIGGAILIAWAMVVCL
jgi:hypothetical protein